MNRERVGRVHATDGVARARESGELVLGERLSGPALQTGTAPIVLPAAVEALASLLVLRHDRADGPSRARTGDLRAASATLSQLSYGPEWRSVAATVRIRPQALAAAGVSCGTSPQRSSSR